MWINSGWPLRQGRQIVSSWGGWFNACATFYGALHAASDKRCAWMISAKLKGHQLHCSEESEPCWKHSWRTSLFSGGKYRRLRCDRISVVLNKVHKWIGGFSHLTIEILKWTSVFQMWDALLVHCYSWDSCVLVQQQSGWYWPQLEKPNGRKEEEGWGGAA